MLIIIPCGKKKRGKRCQALNMYLGAYHRLCQGWALRRAPEHRVLILSAKYGFLRCSDVIDPYELRMGRSGSVGITALRLQAEQMGLLDEDEVIALGGRDYTEMVRHIWPHVITPLTGVGGIGKQLAWLKRESQHA